MNANDFNSTSQIKLQKDNFQTPHNVSSHTQKSQGKLLSRRTSGIEQQDLANRPQSISLVDVQTQNAYELSQQQATEVIQQREIREFQGNAKQGQGEGPSPNGTLNELEESDQEISMHQIRDIIPSLQASSSKDNRSGARDIMRNGLRARPEGQSEHKKLRYHSSEHDITMQQAYKSIQGPYAIGQLSPRSTEKSKNIVKGYTNYSYSAQDINLRNSQVKQDEQQSLCGQFLQDLKVMPQAQLEQLLQKYLVDFIKYYQSQAHKISLDQAQVELSRSAKVYHSPVSNKHHSKDCDSENSNNTIELQQGQPASAHIRRISQTQKPSGADVANVKCMQSLTELPYTSSSNTNNSNQLKQNQQNSNCSVDQSCLSSEAEISRKEFSNCDNRDIVSVFESVLELQKSQECKDIVKKIQSKAQLSQSLVGQWISESLGSDTDQMDCRVIQACSVMYVCGGIQVRSPKVSIDYPSLQSSTSCSMTYASSARTHVNNTTSTSSGVNTSQSSLHTLSSTGQNASASTHTLNAPESSQQQSKQPQNVSIFASFACQQRALQSGMFSNHNKDRDLQSSHHMQDKQSSPLVSAFSRGNVKIVGQSVKDTIDVSGMTRHSSIRENNESMDSIEVPSGNVMRSSFDVPRMAAISASIHANQLGVQSPLTRSTIESNLARLPRSDGTLPPAPAPQSFHKKGGSRFAYYAVPKKGKYRSGMEDSYALYPNLMTISADLQPRVGTAPTRLREDWKQGEASLMRLNSEQVGSQQGQECCNDEGRCEESKATCASEGDCASSSAQVDYFAVFDGHQGTRAAEFCAQQLHDNVRAQVRYVANGGQFKGAGCSDSECDESEQFGVQRTTTLPPNKDQSVQQAIINSFWDTQAQFEATCQNTQVGTTALMALVTGDWLHVGHVGDSRAVLYRSGKAVQLTCDQKTSRTDEQARIKDIGGVIFHFQGAQRVYGKLEMTRAIGDTELKPCIIPEPEVTVVQLSDDDEFIILATDGLWDVMSCESAGKYVAQVLAKVSTSTPETERAEQIRVATMALVDKALRENSRDNVTAVIVDLNPKYRIQNAGAVGKSTSL